jgi:hypothetical protein
VTAFGVVGVVVGYFELFVFEFVQELGFLLEAFEGDSKAVDAFGIFLVAFFLDDFLDLGVFFLFLLLVHLIHDQFIQFVVQTV